MSIIAIGGRLIVPLLVVLPGLSSQDMVYKLEPETVSVAPGPAEREATFNFAIRNTSSAPINVGLSDIIAGCGCSRVSFSAGEVGPNDLLQVGGTIDLESINGREQKSVLIGIGESTSRFKINVQAVEFSILREKVITWSVEDRDSAKVINLGGMGGYRLDSIERDSGHLDCEFNKASDSKYAFTIKADQSLDADRSSARLKIQYVAENVDQGWPRKWIYLSLVYLSKRKS